MTGEWPHFAHPGPLARAEISDTVALASGDLRVEFAIERATRRTVSYRLRATNAGTTPLRCHVSTTEPKARRSRDRHEAKATLLELELAPRELLDVGIDVRARLAASVVAEFSGPGLGIFVRAPDPALDSLAGTRRRNATSVGIGSGAGKLAPRAIAALAAAAWIFPTPLHPRVEALSVPLSATAGSDVQVAYALGGTATGTYRLRDAGGTVIDGGPLASSDGSLTIKVPDGAAPGQYRLEVTTASDVPGASGIVPGETRAAPLTLVGRAAPPNKPQRSAKGRAPARTPVVGDASLERDSVQSGQPIVVDYATTSTAGEVRLLDDRGTVRAEALVNHSGNSILVAPPVDVGQDFRVALDVDDGTRREERLLPVRVEPTPGPSASPGAADLAAAAASGKPFVLLKTTVLEDDPIALEIVRYQSDMRAALLDKDGNELASAPIRPGQVKIWLKPPPTSPPGTYTVDVSYRDSNGQEHAVTPVTIRESP